GQHHGSCGRSSVTADDTSPLGAAARWRNRGGDMVRQVAGLNRAARAACTGLVVVVIALTVLAAGGLGGAGNPIPNTIRATTVDNGNGTVTITVKGEWDWTTHTTDCNYDRAATGAAIAWGDPNGADNSRVVKTAVRKANVVTITTTTTQTWSVGDR